MTPKITLTEKQHDLLQLAATRYFGNTVPAAGQVGLHGGAYEAVGIKLKNLGLLEGDNSGLWHLTEAAYELLGIEHSRPEPNPVPESEPAPESESVPDTPLEVALFEALGGQATLAMGNAPAGAEMASSEAPSMSDPVTEDEQPAPKKRALRDGTKQAQVIDLLKRSEGATLQQIMETTGWQMHTVRSVLSRTIQKDLGIPLVSEKASGGDRIYRVTA